MPDQDDITVKKKICLLEEVYTSTRLIIIGLRELHNIGGGNDFYHLPFQLLSSGFERLMKCMICYKYLNDEGRFPSFPELKGKSSGHDLLYLKNKIISFCISASKQSLSTALKSDYEYIATDEGLEQLITVLSEFGKSARYYNLDVVVGKKDPSPDVLQTWSSYEFDLIKDDESMMEELKRGNVKSKVRKKINREIVCKLERFARALARQFTLGDLGDDANTCVAYISKFLFLTDDDLGETNYSPFYD